MLYFIAAVYNEQDEIESFITGIRELVDGFCIVDDGSTDGTLTILEYLHEHLPNFNYKVIPHTGLPETVKNEAKEMVPDGAWILMLDADERLGDDAWTGILDFIYNDEQGDYDYVYFDQYEIIDGVHVRTFQKCKLFRKEAVRFPLHNIHADDQFEGKGIHKPDWVVYHRKTSYKQIKREEEYLETYKKLLEDGHIDQGRYEWLKGLHHYVK